MKRGRYEVKKEEAMNSRDEGNEAEVRKKEERENGRMEQRKKTEKNRSVSYSERLQCVYGI